MSLKLRLALFNTLFVMLALGLGFFLLSFQTRRVFIESLDRELLLRADRMARNPNLRGQGPPGGGQGQGGPIGPNGPFNNPLMGPGGGATGGGEPGIGMGEGAPGGGQPGGPPIRGQGNNGQNPLNPQGPRNGGIGPRLGPEFQGPPNDDIGRPVLYGPDGKAFDQRETRVLDPKALSMKETRHPILATVPVEGVPTRVITVPLMGVDRLLGYAQYGHDLQDFERLKQTQFTTILLLLPIALLISALVGWFLAGKAVRPITEVALASEKISGSDMSTRLEVKGDDEIGRLSISFNGMVDRLQMSFNERQRLFDELKHALEQQKQFVGDASHELRTPLARLRITTSSALEQESSPAEMKEALEIADRETVHMSNLVDQLLTLARLDSGYSPKMSTVDLSDVVREAVGNSASEGVTIEFVPEAFILGDQDGLIRAVMNLVENAKRYSEGKPILVSVKKIQNRVSIDVFDQGVGIEPQHVARLTERFYRVDDARNRKIGGTGLGLAIVKSIVEANHGELHIHSSPGKGTRVSMSFPAI